MQIFNWRLIFCLQQKLVSFGEEISINIIVQLFSYSSYPYQTFSQKIGKQRYAEIAVFAINCFPLSVNVQILTFCTINKHFCVMIKHLVDVLLFCRFSKIIDFKQNMNLSHRTIYIYIHSSILFLFKDKKITDC